MADIKIKNPANSAAAANSQTTKASANAEGSSKSESGSMVYQCPACGGHLEFDPTIQKLKCPYCDSEYSLDDFDTFKESETSFSASNAGYTEEELEGLQVYQCQSCGAELVADKTLGSTACPYCGNNIVLKGAFAGADRPDFMIPFKFTRKQAQEMYLNHLKGKKFLPKLFSSQNTIDKLQGLYVPFWLFDAKTEASGRFRGTIVSSWEDARYRYTKTDTFSVIREGTMSYENVPADGAKKLEDELMDSIEPFNLEDQKPFNTAYLAGFLCDKYDVSAEDNTPRVNKRMTNSSLNKLRGTANGYASLTVEKTNVNVHNGKAKYVLLPVWVMTTTWNGNQYRFAMNGQTGKFVGNLPMDKSLYWKYFGKIFGALFVGAMIFTNIICMFL